VSFDAVEGDRSGVPKFNCYQSGGNGQRICCVYVCNGKKCCFGVNVDSVGGGFLPLALDLVYSHDYSADFSLKDCTCDI
jgi:hypothetical protein